MKPHTTSAPEVSPGDAQCDANLGSAYSKFLYGLPWKLLRKQSLQGVCVGERIGGGTFGRVVAATETRQYGTSLRPEANSSGQYALKVFRSTTNPNCAATARRMERNALEELSAYTAVGPHPNLPKVLGAGFHQEVPVLLFERADFEAVTLKQYILRQEGKQRLCNTRDILGDICAGLVQLHNLDLLHTDIKPANILLYENKRGIGEPLGPSLLDPPRPYFYSFIRARLLDCPLAKLGDLGSVEPESQRRVEYGDSRFTTACYRAPEHFGGTAPGDVRATPALATKALDAWSFGLTAFELATGRVQILHAQGRADYETAVAAKLADFLRSVPSALHDLEGKLGKRAVPSDGKLFYY